MFVSLAILLLSSSVVPSLGLSVPIGPPAPTPPKFVIRTTKCAAEGASVDVPAGLPAPSGPPTFIALGVGVQNYTCTSAGTYTTAGAVASIFDISCAFGTPAFDSAQDDAISIWSSPSSSQSSASPDAVISSIPSLASSQKLGFHYFITNPITSSGISPVWDFRTDADLVLPNNNTTAADAFVVAARQGGISAPTGAQDVDWLFLTGVSGQGRLADEVYRTDTRLGQPPSSCTPGSDPISIKYTSKYWLVGGSVAQ